MKAQSGVHPTAWHQIVLRIPELALRYRIAPVAKVASVHAQLPALSPVSDARIHGGESISQRAVALVQEPATRVVHRHAAEESFPRLIVQRGGDKIVR